MEPSIEFSEFAKKYPDPPIIQRQDGYTNDNNKTFEEVAKDMAQKASEIGDVATERYANRLISDTDPLSNLPYDWLDILDKFKENVGNEIAVLPDIFQYYQDHSEHFDSWVNYLLACSHFTEYELGLPTSKKMRNKLENKIQQLIRKRKKNPHENINSFYRKNQF